MIVKPDKFYVIVVNRRSNVTDQFFSDIDDNERHFRKIC